MRIPGAGLAIATAWLAALPGGAAAAAAATTADWPDLPVRSATLPNGLQVLVLERHASPTVAFYLHYRVGTVDERPGTYGLSHMLEHLLFKGSTRLGTRNYAQEAPIIKEIDSTGAELDRERARGEAADPERVASLEKRMAELLERERRHIVKDELTDILQRAGADPVNASTWPDATNYFAVLPAGSAEVWLAAWGEQMSRPVLREFYTERDVVMEERRLRIEDDPDGLLLEELTTATFLAHPYRNSDWMSQLRRLSRADAERHFETYYGAGNALLTVVGNVRFDEVMRLVGRHFSTLPRRPPPPEVVLEEPPQSGERRVRVEFDARPGLGMAFHIPGRAHADEPALALMTAVLSGHGTSTTLESGALEILTAERGSRLRRRLVEERGVAQEIAMWGYPGDRYARSLVILATPREPHGLRELEEGITRELQALADETVPAVELERARRNLRARCLRQLESNSGAAWLLGFSHGVTGDWQSLERTMQDLQRVTPEDVQRVARTYLKERKRTVAWREPPPGTPDGGGSKETSAGGAGARMRRAVASPLPVPVRPAPPSFELQQPRRATLPNGVVVFLLPDRALPTFSAGALLRTGSAADPPARGGLAEVTIESIRAGGAGALDGEAFDNALLDLAARIDCDAGPDLISCQVWSPASSAAPALERLADLLKRPALAGPAVRTARERRVEEARREEDDPETVAQREFVRRLFAGQPYGNWPSPESVGAISRREVVEFHKRHFRPANLVLYAAGDFETGAMLERLGALFGDWIGSPGPQPEAPAPAAAPAAAGLTLVPRQLEQSHLMLGHAGPRWDDPDLPALDVLGRLLSYYRYYLDVRDNRGLAYTAYGAFVPRRLGGMFLGYAGTRVEATPETLKLMRRHLEEVAAGRFSDEEARGSSQSESAAFVHRFETAADTVRQFASAEARGRPPGWLSDYGRRLASLTPADLRRAARAHLRPQDLLMVVVGDPGKIGDLAAPASAPPQDGASPP